VCVCIDREIDSGLEEPISSILWATLRLQSEVQELVIVSEQLTLKYGKEYAQSCRANALNTVNEKLLHKLSVQVRIWKQKLIFCILYCSVIIFLPVRVTAVRLALYAIIMK